MAKAKVNFKLNGKWVSAGQEIDLPNDPKKIDAETRAAIANGYLGREAYVSFSSKKMTDLDVKSSSDRLSTFKKPDLVQKVIALGIDEVEALKMTKNVLIEKINDIGGNEE